MAIDWSRVNISHVQQACALYDAGSVAPKRPAKSTFLILDGKAYPAKFIRGLAYRLATGVELDPNKDFSGGDETVRFFAKLGLETAIGSPAPLASPAPAPQLPVTQTTSEAVERRYEPQKQALFDLLRERFGTVETEVGFPWLVVPKLDEMKEPLRAMFEALRDMRGFSTFAGAGRSLKCDFFVPDERLIVEYDERQHFTLQRAKCLDLYPPDLDLGFDHAEWIDACNAIKATDPSPPHRDEQRAFYDSLRDILAVQNGYRLVRFRQGDFDWTGEGAKENLSQAINPGPFATWPKLPLVSAHSEIKRVGLVAHDYNVPGELGLYDYSEHFAAINRLCDDEGCDTILYALFTWNSTSPISKTHASVFSGLKHVQRVVLEVWEPPERCDHVEVWIRGQQEPILAYQRFATSSAATGDKQLFLNDLPRRQIANGLLAICGETNIASLVRGSDEFYDSFEFADQLQAMKIGVILNPIHDYMRRYEMREKRRHYSLGGRTVISVWNQGKGKEAWLPWTVFHDGEERTNQVRELPEPIPERHDIRIGIFDLP